MKFYGIIVLLAVAASSQGAVEERFERSVIDSGLNSLVETLREKLQAGDEDLGIPVLEPFETESLPLSIDADIAQLNAELKNLVVNNLTSFNADTLSFSLLGVRFTYAFSWASITAKAGYSADGVVAGVVPVFGTGDFDLELKDLAVSGSIALSVRNSYLYIRESTLKLTLGGADLKITGLLDNEDLSALASAVISDMVPQLVEDYQTQIAGALNNVIIELGDSVLGTMTLAELIALIRG